jgi:hypothetical protein
MRYDKPISQPPLDSDVDYGGGGPSLQWGAGSPAADAPPGGAGSQDLSTAPGFEDIVLGVDAATPPALTTNGTTTTQTVTFQGSGLVFNNTFGSGATQAFINDVDAAENYLQSLFGNACTVNCSFDVQSLNPNFSGENSFDPVNVSYSQFVNALKSHASTPTAVAAANALSNLSDPTGGHGVDVPIGEAIILGLPINSRTNPDDTVILNSYYWTQSALQNNPGDAEAVIEHEVTEGIMGRIGSLGKDGVDWAPMDFFRFTASGQRDFTGGQDGQPTYFSVDGNSVNTGLQYHNSVNSQGQFDGFDLADWDQVGADASARDPFGPGGPGAGDPGTLSATDIQIMQALGWAPPHQPPSVGGQNFLVAANQAVPISSYFSVSNPGGDNITQYEFKDLGGGSGHFAVNGTAQPDNQVFTVSASDLSTVQYVGGASSGSDTVQVGVFDATTNSADWSPSFTATVPTLIRTDTNSYGLTSLSQAAGNYWLFAPGTVTGPELQYNGAPVASGQFGPWTPIGAAKTANGYEVAWTDGAGDFTVWNTDGNGVYTSNFIVGAVPANNASLESVETNFQQDLNGDGHIGLNTPVTTVENKGATELVTASNSYFFFPTGGSTGPELQYNGSAVVAGQFGLWTPIGVEKTTSGYQVAWTDGAGNFTVWNTDANGAYTLNFIVGAVRANNASLENLETSFQQDLNGDGHTGLNMATTVIQTDNSTSLVAASNNYFLFAAGTTNGPELQFNNQPVLAGEFGAWTPYGAVQTPTGYDVAWKLPGANQYTVWATDFSGNRVSGLTGDVAVPGNNSQLIQLENVFNQDLNGNGTTGGTPIATSQTQGAAPLSDGANMTPASFGGATSSSSDSLTAFNPLTPDASSAWDSLNLQALTSEPPQNDSSPLYGLSDFDFVGEPGSGTGPSTLQRSLPTAGVALDPAGSSVIAGIASFGVPSLSGFGAGVGLGAAGAADNSAAIEPPATPALAGGLLHR